jgi:hypothetical protein
MILNRRIIGFFQDFCDLQPPWPGCATGRESRAVSVRYAHPAQQIRAAVFPPLNVVALGLFQQTAAPRDTRPRSPLLIVYQPLARTLAEIEVK